MESVRDVSPNYPSDLNACREMEAVIYSRPEWRAYARTLYGLVSDGGDGMIHASAAQRCEAFLKTLNLWTP
jgi:hypothetical protein